MRGTILQPTYLPWMGYFEMIESSDIYIVLDHVQFEKQSWQQRNKIKTSHGWQLLTVPVIKDSGREIKIKDVRIDNSSEWAAKHWRAITLNYSKAEFFKDYSIEIGNIYESRCEKLVNLNTSLILLIAKLMGLNKKIIYSSQLSVPGSRVEKLIGLCKQVNADTYLSPAGSAEYIEEKNIFPDNGIRLEYHNFNFPVYRQLYGDFISHLSALDLLFNEGKASLDIIRSGRMSAKEVING